MTILLNLDIKKRIKNYAEGINNDQFWVILNFKVLFKVSTTPGSHKQDLTFKLATRNRLPKLEGLSPHPPTSLGIQSLTSGGQQNLKSNGPSIEGLS